MSTTTRATRLARGPLLCSLAAGLFTSWGCAPEEEESGTLSPSSNPGVDSNDGSGDLSGSDMQQFIDAPTIPGGTAVGSGNTNRSQPSEADLTRSCVEGTCTDFPVDPVADTLTPPVAGAAEMFAMFPPATTSTADAPCVMEPADGTLVPANWLRPRFRFADATGADVFEIRVASTYQANDLVVHTGGNSWTMPAEMWDALRSNAWGDTLTVTIRAMNSASPAEPETSVSTFTIAPVLARGAMVFWSTVGAFEGESWLTGFGVGEDTTRDALRVEQVAMNGRRDEDGVLKRPLTTDTGVTVEGGARCIGCHVSTPGGDAVAFTDSFPWGSVMASIEDGAVGSQPAYVSTGATNVMAQPWTGKLAFSETFWTDTDRRVVTSYGIPQPGDPLYPSGGALWDGKQYSLSPMARLVWYDLMTAAPVDGTAQSVIDSFGQQTFGFVQREGDSRGAMMPDWSPDGQSIAYVSSLLGMDGRLTGGSELRNKVVETEAGVEVIRAQGANFDVDAAKDGALAVLAQFAAADGRGAMEEADIYTVPFNGGDGGPAAPLAGAATPGVAEYYPSYSSDGAFVAFNRVENPEGRLYYNAGSEVFIVPANGGEAVRLQANDQACGSTGAGLYNSWPRWSPRAIQDDAGNTYYWLIFSSARDGLVFPAPTIRDPASQLYMSPIVRTASGEIVTYPAVYLWNQSQATSNHTPEWDVFTSFPPRVSVVR